MTSERPRLVSFSVDTERPFAGADDGAFRYLELFERLSIPATFFVVGKVGERRPDIVDAIHDAGHEVACHGWDHPNIGEPVGERCPFISDLDDSTLANALTRCHDVLTRDDQKPHGFRAPWFRVNANNLAVIGNYFDYDSSLTRRTAARTPLPAGLIELPVSTLGTLGPRLGTSFLFGPGAMDATLAALRLMKAKQPLMLFGHSFDLSGCPPGLHTAVWKRAWYFQRCGFQQTNRLAKLLTAIRHLGYKFVRCRDLAGDGNANIARTKSSKGDPAVDVT